MKKVECPSCGCQFQVEGGRPKNNIKVQKVIELLNKNDNVLKTAKELKCGEVTIYKLLKQRGINTKTLTRRNKSEVKNGTTKNTGSSGNPQDGWDMAKK